MEWRVRWTTPAWSDVEEVARFIARDSPRYAIVLQQRKLNLGRQIKAASAAKQVNRTYATAAYGNRPATMDVQR